MIKKGSHLRIERYLRSCVYCQQQGIYIVEDDLHFLSLAKYLESAFDLRKQFNNV